MSKRQNQRIKVDVARLSDELAADPEVTDYDFWRALKRIDAEFHDIERAGSPIPMTMIHQRTIITRAREKRLRGRR